MSLKSTLKATRLLIEETDADILINRRDVPIPEPRATTRARIQVAKGALDWHADRLATTQGCTTHPDPDHTPVLPDWGKGRAKGGGLAIIGPCPTIEAVRRGEPGWSRAERLLTKFLRDGGVEATEATWLYSCWCWPSSGGGKGQRPPRPEEVDLWRPWVIAALEAADVDRVLLHGAHAVRLWRQDLSITELTGGMYLWRDRWLVHVIPHAASVLRPNGLPVTEWQRDVAAFSNAVVEGAQLEAIAQKCIKCERGVFGWDSDAVPYCRDHFDAGIRAWERSRKKAGQDTRDQGVLL